MAAAGSLTSSTDKEMEYYLEWRKSPPRSLLVPPIKYNTTGCVLNGDIWIFGGKGSSDEFNDLWKYSTQLLEWEYIEAKGSDIPAPRDGHTLTKIHKSKFIVFGGQGELLDSGVCERGTENGKVKYLSMRRLYDDMYEFDSQKLSWVMLPRRKIRPLARRGHSVIYIKPLTPIKGIEHHPDDELLGSAGKGHLLLYGGSCIDLSTGFEKPASDVWLYCLESLTWEEVHCDGQIPLPVYGHCAELIDNQMIIIGGTVLPLKSTRGLQKFPKKKARLDDLGHSLVAPGSSPPDASPNNTISVLNIATMTWTQLTIDISAASSSGLNLIGHSTAVSPVNSKEIFIFGGRRSDENNSNNNNSSYSSARSSSAPPPTATLWTLNIDTATLTETPLRLPKDLSNLPEARLNQLFLRRYEEPVALKPPPPAPEEIKSITGNSQSGGRKGKSSRRAPALPVKRPKLQPHAVLTLFGGSRLYSSGFCGGMFHELFFVPLEKKESGWGAATAGESISGENDLQSLDRDKDRGDMDTPAPVSHRYSTMSAGGASVSSFSGAGTGLGAPPRRMSSLQMMMESQAEEEEDVFHLLNIKENSVTKLSSPKRGVGAHYFAVKTQLSRSRSTFSRPGSGIPVSALPDIRGTAASSPSRRPISAPSALFHEQTRATASAIATDATATGAWESHDSSHNHTATSAGESSSQLSRRQQQEFNREKIKTMSQELCPLIKGLSLHEARQVFQRLHPSVADSMQDPWTAPAPLHASTSAPLLHQSSFNPSLSHLTAYSSRVLSHSAAHHH